MIAWDLEEPTGVLHEFKSEASHWLQDFPLPYSSALNRPKHLYKEVDLFGKIGRMRVSIYAAVGMPTSHGT